MHAARWQVALAAHACSWVGEECVPEPGIFVHLLSAKPLPTPPPRCQANDPEYYQFDQSKTLGEELRGKVVLEYPRLLLVPGPSVGAKYRLVETAGPGRQPPTA